MIDYYEYWTDGSKCSSFSNTVEIVIMILFQWLYSWNYRDYCLLLYSTIFPPQFYNTANILDSIVLVLLVWTPNSPSWSSLLTLHNVIFTKVVHFKWIQFKMTDDQIVKSLIRIENLKIISCLFMYAECFTFNFLMQYLCMCRPYLSISVNN